MESVKNKVIFITGGIGGIGSCIVKELLKNDAKGVSIIDINENSDFLEDLNKTFGPNKVLFIKTDVTNKNELKSAFETTISEFKQLDVVINNAGIIDEHNKDKCLSVNLGAVVEGTYLALQEYLPKHKSGSEGVIINMASILGLSVMESVPLYCATKHAIVGLGKALGQNMSYAKFGVRILTLCPGFTYTDIYNISLVKLRILYPEHYVKQTSLMKDIMQQPECVADALLEIIKIGKNGSVWITEESKPVYEYLPKLYKQN